MFYVIPKRYAVRGSTASDLQSRNEVLLDREQCFETDTGRSKIGDGATPWNDLPYVNYGNADLSSLADGDGLRWNDTAGQWEPAAGVGDNEVTYAKMQDISATARVLGRKTAGSGDPEECTLSEVLDFIGSAAQGDILYRGASGWARLPKGDNGQVMRLASGIPSWSSSAGAGGFAFIAEAAVSGAAATSLTISGLDLAADQCYFILFAFDNATGSSANISLNMNGDTTAANYYSQFLTGDGAGVTAARNNNALIFSLSANETNTGYFFMRPDLDGKPRTLVISNREAPASMRIQFANHIWNSATNVTSISITASVANALAVGSTVRIFQVSG